jgi:hypothetical protein
MSTARSNQNDVMVVRKGFGANNVIAIMCNVFEGW